MRFTVCSGCFTDVQVEQLHWMVTTVITGPGIAHPLPHELDAGLHSVIEIPVIAAASTTYSLEINPRDGKGHAAAVRITMTAPRPASDADRDLVSASEALARAEQLRRSSDGPSAARALSEYDQAIALAQKLGVASLQQLALLGKARVFQYRIGDYLAGLDAANQAKAVAQAHPAPPNDLESTAVEAFTWKVLSSAYYFLARYPEMIDATHRSLALYQKLGDLYWQGILEGNVASVYAEIGDMQHALSSAENALSIAHQLSDAWGIAFSEATLATIHRRRGEYQAALDADEAALAEIRVQPYPDEEGQVWMDLAELYDELNDPERERDALRLALPLVRKTGDTASESNALCDLGELDLREGRLREAEQELQQSMQIAQSHQLHREAALAFLGKAELLAAERHNPEAQAAIDSGLSLAAKTGEVATSAMLLQEEGDLLSRTGDFAAAMTAYRKAESDWSGLANPGRAALARASIARLEFRSGDIPAAHDDILAALDGFEASRRKIGGRTLRESFFASVHDFYDLAVEIDDRMGASEEGWQIAERARARSLMDVIRDESAFSTRDLPAGLIDQSAAVEQRIAAAEQMFSRLESGGDSAALRRAVSALHALVMEADDIEAKERAASSPSLFSSGMHPASLATVQSELLPSDTVLLEYWAGRRSVRLWILTRTSLLAVRLCSTSTLNGAINLYKHLLLARETFPPNEDYSAREARIARADRDLDQQTATLGNLLLPLHLGPAIHRLIVVPDGALASVPFGGLRLRGDYVIRQYEIIEEPSVSVAMNLLTRRGSAPGQHRIAIFADPVYNRFDSRLTPARNSAEVRAVSAQAAPPVLRSGFDLGLSELPRLNASALEARAIASIAGRNRVRSFLGFAATPDQVMRLPWRDFAIAHFATHDIADSTHPELSGIVLSMFDRSGKARDGVLWLHDIYRTPMPVPLVVLSGCRTASGKSIPGEGISGIAQAFLSSGASGVIGALWSVDDAAAGEIIPWFYRALLDQHRTASAALRAAQLHMLALHRPLYDWAGYIVEGNGSAASVAPE